MNATNRTVAGPTAAPKLTRFQWSADLHEIVNGVHTFPFLEGDNPKDLELLKQTVVHQPFMPTGITEKWKRFDAEMSADNPILKGIGGGTAKKRFGEIMDLAEEIAKLNYADDEVTQLIRNNFDLVVKSKDKKKPTKKATTTVSVQQRNQDSLNVRDIALGNFSARNNNANNAIDVDDEDDPLLNGTDDGNIQVVGGVYAEEDGGDPAAVIPPTPNATDADAPPVERVRNRSGAGKGKRPTVNLAEINQNAHAVQFKEREESKRLYIESRSKEVDKKVKVEVAKLDFEREKHEDVMGLQRAQLAATEKQAERDHEFRMAELKFRQQQLQQQQQQQQHGARNA